MRDLQSDKVRSESDIINEAFRIYHSTNTTQVDHLILDELMKLCLTFNHPQRILSLWDDLSSLPGISYVLLLKCCLKSEPIDFGKSLQILRWIKDRNYIFRQFEVRDYSGYLTTLLSKHKHDLRSVQQIHNALHPRIEHNLYVKTSLIR